MDDSPQLARLCPPFFWFFLSAAVSRLLPFIHNHQWHRPGAIVCFVIPRKGRSKKRERDEFVLRDGATLNEFKFRETRAFRKERRELLGQQQFDRDEAVSISPVLV